MKGKPMIESTSGNEFHPRYPVPDDSNEFPAGKMKDWNKTVDAKIRAIARLIKDLNDMSGIMTEDIKQNIVAQAKALAKSFRACKVYRFCPVCRGDGCEKCLETGWCTRKMWERIDT
jgi:hypothetical protein